MYTLVIKNCGQILTMRGPVPKIGKAMSHLGVVKNGFVACEGDRIAEVGAMRNLRKSQINSRTRIVDAGGRVVMPGLIDCHTHLVFAGSRVNEYREKLAGVSYLEILKRGGGIFSTVQATRKASRGELLELAVERLRGFLQYGVTTVEAKSGYGLDLKTELKILEVAREAGVKTGVRVVNTFLGAHVVAPEFKGRPKDYLKFLVDEMLPKVRGKAEFVDIFCEKGAFTVRQSRKYLKAALEMGFGVKIHAEQLSRQGGAKMAAKLGAVSCDHCDYLAGRDMKAMAKHGSVGVLLPLVPFYLREKRWADGRKMIDADVPVAVSTDFNPGSAPSKNIFLAMSLACMKMGLTVEEVLSAVTVNAACALGFGRELGSLVSGKKADLVVMNVSDYSEIPYWLGENMVRQVIVGGKLLLG